jgi:CheY-like chemotaxis protein
MERSRPLIMLVDDSRGNLLAGKTALSEDYSVQTVSSAARMLEALEWRRPDLILLDVDMPEMNGFEAIGILKERPETRDIPVIFLTAMNASANELEGLRLGAIDYIAKPFSPPLLRQRIALQRTLVDQAENGEIPGLAEAPPFLFRKAENATNGLLGQGGETESRPHGQVGAIT